MITRRDFLKRLGIGAGAAAVGAALPKVEPAAVTEVPVTEVPVMETGSIPSVWQHEDEWVTGTLTTTSAPGDYTFWVMGSDSGTISSLDVTHFRVTQ